MSAFIDGYTYATRDDQDAITRHEIRQWEDICEGRASLDEVCSFFGFCAVDKRPLYAMLNGVDLSDPSQVDGAIRAGIHAIAPSLDSEAYHFSAAVIREFSDAAYGIAAE